jgi:signal peptidase I
MSSASESANASRQAGWRHELPRLAFLLVLLFVARSSFANHYVVPSGSMQHTLEIGDRVMVDMRAYGLRLPITDTVLWPTGTPQRGDVAVFDSPVDGTRLIKRVAAVGGDHVQLHGGRLWINGQALAGLDGLQERFPHGHSQLDLGAGGGPDIDGLVVPAGQVLMLGDHRGDSADGRYFGLVPAQSLYGRAAAVYWRRGEGLTWDRL